MPFGPRPQSESDQLIDRTVFRWAALVTFLVLVIGALTLALVSQHTAKDAARKANSTAECVNAVLSTRAGPTARDTAAHLAFAKSLQAVFAAKGDAQQKTAVDAFKAEINRYADVLAANQSDRAKNPLGRC